MGRPSEAVDSNVEPNLVEPNYKSEHDTNVNGGYSAVQITKKMRKIQNAERACFSGKCDQGEQKVTPDVVSTKQPKTSLEFGLASIISYTQRNITVPRQVLCCQRFFQDSFILLFSLKNMASSTTPNSLLSNPLYYTPVTVVLH